MIRRPRVPATTPMIILRFLASEEESVLILLLLLPLILLEVSLPFAKAVGAFSQSLKAPIWMP